MDSGKNSPLIRIQGLTVRYEAKNIEQCALRDVSFSIYRGERLAIVGETGSGKTTLGRVLLNINDEKAVTTFQSINIEKEQQLSISSLNELNPLRGKTFSMLFQEPTLYLNPVMKCGHQILEAMLLDDGLDKKEAVKHILEELGKVGFATPEKIYNSYSNQLSGGECQRVMLVMATIRNPALLVADEPTSSLDIASKQIILEYLQVLCESKGMSIVLISHDLSLALDHSDRILVMSKGKMVDAIDTANFSSDEKSEYTQKLFLNSEKLANRSITERQEKLEEPFLTVTNLNIHHVSSGGRSVFFNKKLHALKNASFSIQKGETLGILGESGSGKSSLAWCLAGLLKSSSGSIDFMGNKMAKGDIQMVFQNPGLALSPKQKVGKAVEEVLVTNKLKYNGSYNKDQTSVLFDMVNLDHDLMDRLPHHLSGGEKQRVCIAKALAANPQLIIFDEAVSSLDASVKLEILELLVALRNKLNLTYIFISHDFSVIKFVAERVMVMHQGEIIEQNSTQQIINHQDNPVTSKLVLQS
ncbi:ABC transporter ATP-binding protein [Reichenbachiella sp. MALMAid0571]|uniref:ABC transporter ATP-binding protein n=1 Tax=Reichenbachiella sp. MALMAid0571 TaxID=3143939 RepID=UPI0032DF06FB